MIKHKAPHSSQLPVTQRSSALCCFLSPADLTSEDIQPSHNLTMVGGATAALSPTLFNSSTFWGDLAVGV